VNTSNESQKSGVSKEEMITLAKAVFQNEDQQYGNIVLKGLMTIGKLEGDPREDFQVLPLISNCFSLTYRHLSIAENL
jgi:uncharacterized pyridoxal phosphate-containing UPF0001 family protein